MKAKKGIYKIKWQSNGVNVNEVLGAKSPHPVEKEIAVPKKISISDIVDAKPIKNETR